MNELDMKIVDTYPIGTIVWYFEPELGGECDVKKSVVLGSFINKQEGELFYFLLDKQVQGYAVWDSEQKAREMRDVFMLYREQLLKANEENSERYKKMRKDSLFKDYEINELAGIEGRLGDLDGEESTVAANDE